MSELIELDHSILYLMNRVVARLNRSLHEQLLLQKLSFQHWRVLSVLSVRRQPTIAEISEYAVIPHSTLSRLLTRMETEGLVRRKLSAIDERAVKISITSKGRSILKQITPIAVQIREDALAEFSKDEVEAFRKKLTRLYKTISRDDKFVPR